MEARLIFSVQIILMFGFFFGLLGMVISVFMELEKGSKWLGRSFMLAASCLGGLAIISKF